jgi:pyruvate dehydrogenase E1 component
MSDRTALGHNSETSEAPAPKTHLAILERIRQRVLWLATYSIHYANALRPGSDEAKVGGHQASCASVASIMTALYFHALRAGDRVAVKPHASPVFHAIQALRGFLPPARLSELRQFGGLQAYPSRTLDPDGVDFSTGSVGLGSLMPSFSAFVHDFVGDKFDLPERPRYFSLLGDAELYEGTVWEALEEDHLAKLPGLIWIVDLNRQSLDRVIPDGKVKRLESKFRLNDWYVIELKYGSRLQQLFYQPGGEQFRRIIDRMTNAEYQSLICARGGDIRKNFTHFEGHYDGEVEELLAPYSDEQLKDLLADLGGHDLGMLMRAFDEADQHRDQPVLIVAYTIKGWGLPFAGHPLNHSMLLTDERIATLRQKCSVEAGDEFGVFDPVSQEARYIADRETVLRAPAEAPSPDVRLPEIPLRLDLGFSGMTSTQSALGRVLMALSRNEELTKHIVTTSPDVAVSTNLGGWINRVGVYSGRTSPDYFDQTRVKQLVRWVLSPEGNHIELGISENNFFLLLTALGLSAEFTGIPLLPIGTVYDCFVARGLDALTYGANSRAGFIFVGTPAGIALGPEGGAHQSIYTPGLAVQMPNLAYYEPAFAQHLEWILLHALECLWDPDRRKLFYLRLSTRRIPQEIGGEPGEDTDDLYRAVLAGGYRLVDRRSEPQYDPAENVVNIFACGAVIPEAVAAGVRLLEYGVLANVFDVTSCDLLYRGWSSGENDHLSTLVEPRERRAPIVTAIDGHSHSLAFIGTALEAPTKCLGVNRYGQSGSLNELYADYSINADAIFEAGMELVRR